MITFWTKSKKMCHMTGNHALKILFCKVFQIQVKTNFNIQNTAAVCADKMTMRLNVSVKMIWPYAGRNSQDFTHFRQKV